VPLIPTDFLLQHVKEKKQRGALVPGSPRKLLLKHIILYQP